LYEYQLLEYPYRQGLLFLAYSEYITHSDVKYVKIMEKYVKTGKIGWN